MLSKLPLQSGHILKSEFTAAMLTYIHQKTLEHSAPSTRAKQSSQPPPQFENEEDDSDEEDEMPDECKDLDPDQQQAFIKRKACMMMGMGTLLVLVFSDPMVGVMSNVGARLRIPPFYVSFVLAPLASNASEFIASYAYASKKTAKTITVSLSSLEGAACMNNTFCLAIFMALIYFKGLAWKFSAETIAILVVEALVAMVAVKRTMSRMDGILVGSAARRARRTPHPPHPPAPPPPARAWPSTDPAHAVTTTKPQHAKDQAARPPGGASGRPGGSARAGRGPPALWLKVIK